MVNRQKSKCQLRLEARSRACSPKASADGGCGSVHEPESESALLAVQLAVKIQSRIARAAEARASRNKQRTACARARVLHAQRVAREQRAKRREETRSSRISAREKLEVARERRRAQLSVLQLQCKRRVDHVLTKVELVREDQLAREERARAALEGQLDDAARRREAQTQQLVRRLSARWQSVESVKSRVACAKFIQRWLRRHVAARATARALRAARADVRAVGDCWTQMADARTSFEDSMGLLQQRPLVKAAQSVLRVLLASEKERKQPTKSSARPSPGGRSSVSFRVLLMAGMIACHPKEIMAEDHSERLLYAAKAMVAELQRLQRCLSADARGRSTARELKTRVSRLDARFAFYMAAFTRWKARDAERLATELLASYRELLLVRQKYAAQASEVHAGDGVHELLPQTDRQLRQIHAALERVLGREQAGERVQQAKQSVLHASASTGSDTSNKSDATGTGSNQQSEGTNPSTPTSSGTNASPSSGADGNASSPGGDKDDDMQDKGEPQSQSQTAHASPPAAASALLQDRALVHELILNPDFRVPSAKEAELAAAAAAPQSTAALAVRVRETMTRAFWDRVVAAGDVETLLARSEELRTGFRDALGGGKTETLSPRLSALADQVDAALHADSLRELMQDPAANVRALEARCHGVLDAIERAEAPARVEATREFRRDWAQRVAASALAPVQLLVAFLAFALEKVDELRGDVLNAHLGLLAAYLQRHGVEYEQKQLEARLAAGGKDGESVSDRVHAVFPLTYKWLQLELDTYLARGDVEDTERMLLQRSDGPAFQRVVRASIWALVEKHVDGSASRVWPETFELDVARVRGCRDVLDRVAVVSSLLAVVQEYVARQGLTAPPGFAQGLGQRLSTLLRSPGVSGIQLATQAVQEARQLEDAARDGLEADLEALERRLQGSFASDNPVFALFFSRAARAFEAQLLLPRATTASTSTVELHASLAPFADEISEAAAALVHLAQHNQSVYASVYNSMLKRLVASHGSL